jgi:ferredoxin-NADP reductase/ferredoxin
MTTRTEPRAHGAASTAHEILTLRVVERQHQSDGVIALTIARLDGKPLPGWTPGAHIDVQVGDGSIRQYSLCSDPADNTHWRVGVLNAPEGRGGSRLLHETAHAGSTIQIGTPRNNFGLAPSPRYRFVAGGIGITPILPMLRQATRDGADWTLVYGGRTRSSMAFLDELAEYGDRVQFVPEDTDGRVDFASYFAGVQADTLIYACGPEPLLRVVEDATEHWPEGSLHLERFAPKVVAHPEDDAFEVTFELSGVTATVPAGKSILEIAEINGISVDSSCREGTCGTCETYLLEGYVDHRDSILTSAERADSESLFICVSRAKKDCPRLILEL